MYVYKCMSAKVEEVLIKQKLELSKKDQYHVTLTLVNDLISVSWNTLKS